MRSSDATDGTATSVIKLSSSGRIEKESQNSGVHSSYYCINHTSVSAV